MSGVAAARVLYHGAVMEASATIPGPAGNVPEFGVAEISQRVRATVEAAFERVRIRGEIGRVTTAASGHVYLSMKEDKAVLDCVCWSRTANRLTHRPEQGLEMVATGRLTTYAGRSSYQLIIESLEPAGLGALMVLLEKRRKQLEAEGLFDPAARKPLPPLPAVIGVVTSPTGAVIRDILHRLRERFPRHVLVWPVPVQGEAAGAAITAAIEGFNAIARNDRAPRPGLIIVARGGGSFEDLMPFNEESVVRAVAASAIPVISAVGHETDTTLIDHAADLRAPTPTAAAEIAVPVRAELMARLIETDGRLVRATTELHQRLASHLAGLARGLPRPGRILEQRSQDLDHVASGLDRVMSLRLAGLGRALDERILAMPQPGAWIADRRARLAGVASGINAELLAGRVARSGDRLAHLADNLERAIGECLTTPDHTLTRLNKLLESLSYRSVLERGYAVVRSAGKPVTRAAGVGEGQHLAIEFADATVDAVTGSGGKTSRRRTRPKGSDTDQFSLF